MNTRQTKTHEWARLGAGARLTQIDEERAAILKAFPELRGTKGAAGSSGRAGRRQLTAAARRKLSAGMRKYWTRRKAQAAAKSK